MPGRGGNKKKNRREKNSDHIEYSDTRFEDEKYRYRVIVITHDQRPRLLHMLYRGRSLYQIHTKPVVPHTNSGFSHELRLERVDLRKLGVDIDPKWKHYFTYDNEHDNCELLFRCKK